MVEINSDHLPLPGALLGYKAGVSQTDCWCHMLFHWECSETRVRARRLKDAVGHPGEALKLFRCVQLHPVVPDGDQPLGLKLLDDFVDLNRASTKRAGQHTLSDRQAESPIRARA